MDKLERKLRIFIEKALEQGYYLRRYMERDLDSSQPVIDTFGGCCLLGIVIAASGEERIPFESYEEHAARLLKISALEALNLEAGFEQFLGAGPLVDLGAKITADYHI